VSTAGEAPRQIFEAECEATGLGLRATGSGSTRRLAEQQAAAKLLEQIGA
jgi:ribonuclease III